MRSDKFAQFDKEKQEQQATEYAIYNQKIQAIEKSCESKKQARLEVVKWKIEQVDLFHEQRDDIETLREEARQLHHELETLKKS